jgi:hypothetical protein
MTLLQVALAGLKLWSWFVIKAQQTQLLQAGRDGANYDAMRQAADETNRIYDALGDLRSRIIGGKLPDNLYRD